MTKIKQKLRIQSVATPRSISLAAVAFVFVAAGLYVPYVRADQYDDQIKALNAENSQKAEAQGQLGAEADGLADEVNKLQVEINASQASINANQAKMADLNAQIKNAEAELAKQRDLLGQTIRAMYVEGDISTVEMLATSKDLSDFFDKQQYRESVRTKIKNSLDTITKLKLELAAQKETVTKLIAEQEELKARLASQQADRNQKLSLNQAQQNDLDAQIKANKAKTLELRAQQLAANAALLKSGRAKLIPGSNGNDTYPNSLRAAAQDTIVDQWGMYNRECVSYTAWKVYESGRFMPNWGGVGNANQWPGDARRAGIPVDSNPKVGDVAIATGSGYGSVGHAMYVEAVGSGTIRVSQYNFGVAGTYSEMNISPAGMQFIHFP